MMCVCVNDACVCVCVCVCVCAVADSGAEHVLPQDHSLGASQPHPQFLPRGPLCSVWILCHEGDVRLPQLQVSSTRGS